MTRVALLDPEQASSNQRKYLRAASRLGKLQKTAAFPHFHRACDFCWQSAVFHKFGVSPIILNENSKAGTN
jgi:hypothetical protein